MLGKTLDDDDAIFDDERATAIFFAIFDKTPDGSYEQSRDAEIGKVAHAELVALGYTSDQANRFLNENFDCCDSE